METKLSSVDSGYAKRRKEHLALINQLRAIGAQADLDLPRIAVIGNQSAGKSSLVEAISGINVPRDAGTCTRCPMECRLSSSSGPWHCQVSIRQEFNADGSRRDEVCEELFGGVITNKADVEMTLRRAQYAILNPGFPREKALSLSLEQLKNMKANSLKFSRNAVCVDLSGPDLTDLAFVDLPGIIQNADTETVHLVEDLVRSHIKGNTLILVTVPMSDDIENQKAVQIAKDEDPSGLRTIGVMTKPDTITAGASKSRELWLDTIEGRRFPLRHGYYCTRQPDDDERINGITAEKARAAEQDFFAKTAPWSRSTQQQRFGTRNLIASLSKLLSQIIDDTLPSLQSQVTQQLQTCSTRLSALPPPITTEPSAYVLSMVTAFCHDVSLLVQGDSQHASLVQQNRSTYAAYKREIRSSAPRFMPYTNAKDKSSGGSQSFELEDDDDDDEPIVSSQLIYLEDVRRHIQKSLTRELPNNVPYSAKTVLIHKTQDSWQFDSNKCLDAAQKSLETTVSKLVNHHFQRYENLKSRLIHAIMDLLRSKYDDTWKQILFVLQCESSPYTQNGHYLQVTKDKYLAKYKDARAGNTSYEEPASKRQKTAVVPSSDNVQGNGQPAAPAPSPFTFGLPVAAQTNATPAFGQPSVNPASITPKLIATLQPNAQQSPPTINTTLASGSTPAASPAATGGSFGGSSSSQGNAFGFAGFNNRTPATTATPASPPRAQKRPLLEDDEREKLENEALSILAKLGYTNTTAEDFGKLVPPDVYEQEMDVMAEVRAYFQVSYKRVIDNVPMTIDHMFLFAFASALQPYLIEKLGLGSASSAARCAAYLSEDPHIVAEREELMSRQKRLESVQTELFNFGL